MTLHHCEVGHGHTVTGLESQVRREACVVLERKDRTLKTLLGCTGQPQDISAVISTPSTALKLHWDNQTHHSTSQTASITLYDFKYFSIHLPWPNGTLEPYSLQHCTDSASLLCRPPQCTSATAPA